MSENSVRRTWKCAECGRRSVWREGWAWSLEKPVETLDSFRATCSPECRAAA